MSNQPREDLPENLARQLRRLEQIGNAEADLAHEEAKPATEGPVRKARIISETSHRYQTVRHRYLREAKRTRQLAMVLLALSPMLTVAYIFAAYADRSFVALMCMLAAGACLGLGLTTLYFSNRRQQQLETSEGRSKAKR